MAPSSSDSSSTARNKQYDPSQFTVDETTGDKWRLCAGAAVLNYKNELLVGERMGVPGAWQCAQGGVDDGWKPEGGTEMRPKETIVEACSREIFEEMGLVVGKHVFVDTSFPAEKTGIRYRTSGTSSWLTKAGFTGQELYWTVY